MPRLFVLSGDELGRTADFEGPAVLGRAKEADVRLHGVSISRKHARFAEEGGRWVLEDLGSSNGIFVDGRRVKRAFVDDGDEFRLGDVELRFRVSVPAAGASKPPPRTSAAPPAGEPPLASPAPPTGSAPMPGSAPPAPEPPQPVVEEPLAETLLTRASANPPAAPPIEDEIELEGDWSDDPPPPPPAPAPSQPSPAPSAPARSAGSPSAPAKSAAAGARKRAAALGAASAGGARATTSGKRILQYNRVPNAGGFAGADLAQQSALVRFAVYLLVAAFFAGLAYGTFRLTQALRSGESAAIDEP